ncbi:helix-turn-helix domain-containing protein [Paenibacillus sp. LMG 31460]|uniref:Helix-turn-helix domain-containing protein n=1 Tax=Paenibacillus germinis TaxID=2654979 RepID=A0ABX1YWW6_9BACL|nr:helix-turn-helix domain-containing protein [Paenibacillus germinis]NOU85618.1 helix-turn-helix domain-containing protein [Paenibacillus germinis]
MKWVGQSFLIKLILFSVLLGTFPVIAVGMFSYFNAASKIQEMAVHGNRQILLQTEQRVEQTLKTVDTAVTQFISSPNTNSAINALLQNHSFQTSQWFGQLVSGMHHLQTFELGVHDVYLIHSANQWLIRNDGIYSFDQLEPGDREQVRMYTSRKKQSEWIHDVYIVPDRVQEGNESGENASSQYNGGISLVKKLVSGSGTIVAKISRDELEKLLLKSSKLGNVMMLGGNYEMLAFQKGVGMAQAIQSNSWMDQLKSSSDREGLFEAVINGNRAIVSYRKSDYYGFVYVSIISIDVITRESDFIKWVTFGTCAVVLLIILVAAFLGSRQMYSPIRKSQDLMSAQIDNQLEQLKHFFILRLCLGEVKESEIRSKLALFPETAGWNTYGVVAVQIDSFEGSKYTEQDRDLLSFAVCNIVSELIPVGRRLTPLLMDQAIVIIAGYDETDSVTFKNDMYTWAEMIQNAVNRYLQLQVSIGVSRFYGHPIETSIAYRQSLDTLKYRISLGKQSIMFIEDVYPGSIAPRQIPPLLESGLFDAIKSGESETAYGQLERMLAFVTEAGLSPLEVQMLLMRLVTEIIRMIQEAGLSVSAIYAEKPLIDQLLKLSSVKEIGHWLRHQVMRPALEKLEQQKEHQFQQISREVIQLITEGYDTDLSLESCAIAINYNPHYVSRVFRQETGMTFSEYLSRYRLGMAKKWLIETEMKVGEIAERLKYATTTNFIRHFRKAEAVTPGQFREQQYKPSSKGMT